MFLVLLACTSSGNLKLILTVDASLGASIPTLINLSWTNPEELTTHVEFTDGEVTMSTPAQTGTAQTQLLVGMPASTDVSFQVFNDETGDVIGEGSITTGSLGAGYSPFTVTDIKGPGFDGFFVTTSLGGVVGPMIVDNRGNIIWWHEDDPSWVPSGARLSADKQWVIYTNQPQATIVDEGELVRVSIDGETVERWTLPGCHHDFAETPEGNVVVLSQATSMFGEDEAVGDRLLEVDVSDPNATNFTEVWNIFENWPDATWTTNTEDDSTNWSHGNAIDYSAVEDAWYMSFRNFGSIVKIDRASRQTEWVLGGELSDYEISGDDQGQFEKQHQFEVFEGEGTVLVFDDRDARQGFSRAVEYALDSGAGTAELVWEYKADPVIQSVVLGDVDRLDNGNTMIMFSTSGQLDVVDEKGDLLWRLNAGLGTAMGYFDRVDSLYP